MIENKISNLVSDWLMRSSPQFGARSVPVFSGAVATSTGRARNDNQDRVLFASYSGSEPKEDFEFFAVCDGLGGLQEGARCASEALGQIVNDLIGSRREFDRSLRLRHALERANASIYSLYSERGGTTFTGVLLTHNGGAGAAVGDTRLYLHESTGALKQLSVDDTIAAHVAGIDGDKNESKSRNGGPFSNHLTQMVGQSTPVRPQIIDLRVAFSDSGETPNSARPKGVLIASDGVHRMPSQALSSIVDRAESAREVVVRLVQLADWLGGEDNASVVYAVASKRVVKSRSLVPALVLQDPWGELQLSLWSGEQLPTFSGTDLREVSSGNRGDPKQNSSPGVKDGSAAEIGSRDASKEDKSRGQNKRRKRAKTKRPDAKVESKAADEPGQPQFDILISQEPEK